MDTAPTEYKANLSAFWGMTGPKLIAFTPEGNPAHPSAVKRTLYEENGHVMMNMNVLCQAQKDQCDALVKDFEVLNRRIRENLKRQGY